MKGLELTVSGTYINGRGERSDFIDVKGTLPAVDIDVATMHMQARYIERWLKEDSRYAQNGVRRVQSMYVENALEVECDFSFMGKSILEMSSQELQDLATYKDLRAVPVTAQSSLRDARIKAYQEYSLKVLGKPVKIDDSTVLSSLPSIIAGGAAERERAPKISNEDVIGVYEKEEDAEENQINADYSLQDLRELCTRHGIKFSFNAGMDNLREKLQSAGHLK